MGLAKSFLLLGAAVFFAVGVKTIEGQITLEIEGTDTAPITTTLSSTFPSGDVGNVENSGSDNSSLLATGQIRKVFSLDRTMRVNKFTRLSFSLDAEQAAAAQGVCIYREDEEVSFQDSEIKCFMISDIEDISLPGVQKFYGDSSSNGEQRENIALEKTAEQSSTYTHGYASKAVDGNTFGEFNFGDKEANSVTHTTSEEAPKWSVDLGGDFIINEILIYKRTDGYNGRLYDFSVIVTDEDGNETFRKVDFDTESEDINGDTVSINTMNQGGIGILGRKVQIRLNNDSLKRVLCLAEVMVFGAAFKYDLAIGKLLNLKPTDANRLAIVQHNIGDNLAKSKFSNFKFYPGPTEENTTGDWTKDQGPESDINIQGTGTITRSEEGSYIALKDPLFSTKILTFYDGETIIYEDELEVVNFAVSDDGLMIASFERDDVAIVRILSIKKGFVARKDRQVEVAGYGRGLSISKNSADEFRRQKVAIGDTNKSKVFIFYLNGDQLNKEVGNFYEIPSPRNTQNFGDKLGLSPTGNSLVIAAPSSEGKNSQVQAGSVYLFTFDETLNRWQQNDEILYGETEKLKLGGGGVAVDDEIGRIDANDSMGNRSTFDYTIRCSDPLGVPIGKNANKFIPQCACTKDYKSSNSIGGKILREKEDVCIPCKDPDMTGDCRQGADGPTQTPTVAPSTARPTALTDAPSFSPSINKDPSASPSDLPSVPFGSLYDGQSCNYASECKSERCTDKECDAGALSIISRNAEDEESEVLLTLDRSLGIGGVVGDESSITLFGDVEVTYELSTPTLVNRLTTIEVKISSDGNQNGLKVCAMERGEKSDCLPLTEDSPKVATKSLLLRYITFEQDGGTSAISDIKLVTAQTGVFDNDGNCVDDNASKVGNNRCVCNASFVVMPSLKQDKRLTKLDACRSCSDTDKCSYDGGFCEDETQDCYDNNCEENTCKPGILSIEKDDGDTIDATFDGPFGGFNTTDQNGGTIARASSIKLFGNLQTLYEFPESIKVNKNTKLQFTYPINGDNVHLCLFLAKDGDDYARDEVRCIEISKSTVEIEVGKEMFLSRKVEVNYIGFKHETTFIQPRTRTAELANLRFKEIQSTPQVQGGQCVDPNANIIAGQDCQCKLGFVASNGGRILKEFDTCVPCLEPCRYDGDTCNYDRDCFTGRCGNDKSCVAGSFEITKVSENTVSGATFDAVSNPLSSQGGVLVDESGTITMFGNTTEYFTISPPVMVNRLSKITVDAEADNSFLTLEVCLYDDYSPLHCQTNCHTLKNFGLFRELPVDELLNSRETQVTHIAFKQHYFGSEDIQIGASFENVRVTDGTRAEDILRGNECRDDNAHVVTRTMMKDGVRTLKKSCKCSDGYVSSHVGTTKKLLRDQDICLKCTNASACKLAGKEKEICANDLITDMFPSGLNSEPTRLHSKMVGAYPPYDKSLYSSKPPTNQGGSATSRIEFTDRNTQEEVSYSSVALNGFVSNAFQLEGTYTVDKFSKMYFEVSSDSADFLTVCFDGNIGVHNSTNILCLNLSGERSDWDSTSYPLLRYNLALGKPTSQSSEEEGYISSYAVDGNSAKEEYSRTLIETFPWWEVDLENEFAIERIVIRLKDEENLDYLSDYKVDVFDSSGEKVFNYYGAEASGDSKQFEKVINANEIPLNVIGSKVRITMNGDDERTRILALKQVEVHQRVYGPNRVIEIPFGTLKDGMPIEHIAFIHHPSGGRNAVSNVQNFNFIFGQLPKITSAPSTSSSPSSSSIPSATPTFGPSLAPISMTSSMTSSPASTANTTSSVNSTEV